MVWNNSFLGQTLHTFRSNSKLLGYLFPMNKRANTPKKNIYATFGSYIHRIIM